MPVLIANFSCLSQYLEDPPDNVQCLFNSFLPLHSRPNGTVHPKGRSSTIGYRASSGLRRSCAVKTKQPILPSARRLDNWPVLSKGI